MKKTFLALIMLCILFLVFSGSAFATYYACVSQKNGSITVLPPGTTNPSCPRGTYLIKWDQQGPPGVANGISTAFRGYFSFDMTQQPTATNILYGDILGIYPCGCETDEVYNLEVCRFEVDLPHIFSSSSPSATCTFSLANTPGIPAFYNTMVYPGSCPSSGGMPQNPDSDTSNIFVFSLTTDTSCPLSSTPPCLYSAGVQFICVQ